MYTAIIKTRTGKKIRARANDMVTAAIRAVNVAYAQLPEQEKYMGVFSNNNTVNGLHENIMDEYWESQNLNFGI